MAKQSLLLVDSDERSRRVLEISLKKAGFNVTTASSGEDALETVDLLEPDLIISDTRMPDFDGFTFCSRLKQNKEWARIPFIFLTSEKAIEDKIRGLELGVEDYLTKPIYIKEIVTRVRILLQKAARDRMERRDSRTKFEGVLADLAVVDLLQTIDISHKSGVIHLRDASGKQAEVYFRDGDVIDAELGLLRGESAVYRLLTWSDGRFEAEFKPVHREPRITVSNQGLLMEGLRRLDEWGRLLEELPPLTSIFEVNYRELSERLGEIPDEVNQVLRLFDGRRMLHDVVDDCSLADLETLNLISKLYFEGIIYEAAEPPPDPGHLAPPALEGWLRDPLAAAAAFSGATAQKEPEDAGSGAHGDGDDQEMDGEDPNGRPRRITERGLGQYVKKPHDPLRRVRFSQSDEEAPSSGRGAERDAEPRGARAESGDSVESSPPPQTPPARLATYSLAHGEPKAAEAADLSKTPAAGGERNIKPLPTQMPRPRPLPALGENGLKPILGRLREISPRPESSTTPGDRPGIDAQQASVPPGSDWAEPPASAAAESTHRPEQPGERTVEQAEPDATPIRDRREEPVGGDEAAEPPQPTAAEEPSEAPAVEERREPEAPAVEERQEPEAPAVEERQEPEAPAVEGEGTIDDEVPYLEEDDVEPLEDEHGPEELAATSGEIHVASEDALAEVDALDQRAGSGVVSGSIELGLRDLVTEEPPPRPTDREVSRGASEERGAPAAERGAPAEEDGPTAEERGPTAEEDGAPAEERGPTAADPDITARVATVAPSEIELPGAGRSGLGYILVGLGLLAALALFLLLHRGTRHASRDHRPPGTPTAETHAGPERDATLHPDAARLGVDGAARIVPPQPRSARDAGEAIPDGSPRAAPDGGVVPIAPEGVEAEVRQAKKLLKRRRTASAGVAKLKAVLQRAPGHAEARRLLAAHAFALAKRLLDSSNYDGAARAARESVTYDPNHAQAWMTLGFTLVQLKRPAEARAALERYLQICPKCQWAGYVRQKLKSLK